MLRSELMQNLIERKYKLIRLNGKRPIEKAWQSRTETVPFEQFSEGDNVGLLLGAPTKIVDIDIDDAECLKLSDIFLPETDLIFGRPSRPRNHRFYRVDAPGETTQFQGHDGMLVEVRSTGCQTMIPPSRHPDSHEELRFENFGLGSARSHDELVAGALELAIAGVVKRHWKKGQRHRLSLGLAAVLNHAGWDQSRSRTFVGKLTRAFMDEEPEDRARCVSDTYHRGSKFSDELSKFLAAPENSALQRWLGISPKSPKGKFQAKQDRLLESKFESEAEAANAFCEDRKSDLIFDPRANLWYSKSNGVFSPATFTDVQTQVLAFGEKLKPNLGIVYTDSDLDNFTSNFRISQIISLSRSYLGKNGSDFDSNPNLIGCKNGIVNLTNGAFHKDDQSIVTKMVGSSFDPKEQCPLFIKFLNDIFDKSQSSIDFIQKLIGYTLSGETSEQKMFICIGSGRNGKSTFLNVISNLMNDYHGVIPVVTLMQNKNGNTNDYEIASLKGKRFAVCHEGDKNSKLAEAKVKSLTGGDVISVRQIYGKPEIMKPAFKIWFGTNDLPVIESTSEAIWRRIVVIPFSVTIDKQDIDINLESKLVSELSGILNFAMEGYAQWKKHGLNPPASILNAIDNYRCESDSVQSFIDDVCGLHRDFKETSQDLYNSYHQWCSDEGITPLILNNFGKELKKKGFIDGRNSKGKFWNGLKLPVKYNNFE